MSNLNYLEGSNQAFDNSHAMSKLAHAAFESKQIGLATSLIILSGEEALKSLACGMKHYFPHQPLESLDGVFKYHDFKHSLIIASLEFMETYIDECQGTIKRVKDAYDVLGLDHIDQDLVDQHHHLIGNLNNIILSFDHKYKVEMVEKS